MTKVLNAGLHAPRPDQRFLFLLEHELLSLLEVVEVLQRLRLRFRLVGHAAHAAVVEAPALNPRQVMARLGGTFKLARVVTELPVNPFPSPLQLAPILDAGEFYGALGDKAEWAVSVYLEDREEARARWTDALRAYFADRLRRERVRKARYLVTAVQHGARGSPELLSTAAVRRGLLGQGFEVLAAGIGRTMYVGPTTAFPDHDAFRGRDFGRPAQHPELAVGPRLARLLVNLSAVPPSGVLLDPFCGVGTILQEALLLGLDVRGLDVDSQRVANCRENLRWLTMHWPVMISDLGGRIKQGDARQLSRDLRAGSVDGIVTEPILLPAYRARPSEAMAQAAIAAAGRIYGVALAEMAAVLKPHARIVLVVPVLRTHGRAVTLEVQEAAEAAGLRFYQPRSLPGLHYPLLEVPRANQIVVRGVHVLERG